MVRQRGWVRTENLTVRDLTRSPIASGAGLTMASSASLAGTQPWTRLTLRFIASSAHRLRREPVACRGQPFG